MFFRLALPLGLVLAHAASASIDHPSLLPLGEQEAFLANTALALRSSATSFYFNPASLTGNESARVAVSASTYTKTSLTVKGIIRGLDGTDLDYSASGFQTIPSAVASSRKLSESWYVGFGAFVPEAFSTWNRTDWDTPNFKMNLFQVHSDEMLRLGGALAVRLGEAWSLGLGTYLGRYSAHSQVALVLESATGANTASTSIQSMEGTSWDLLVQLGLQYHPGANFTLGSTLTAPSWAFKGRYDLSIINNQTKDGAVTKESNSSSDTSAKYRFPLSWGLGARWAPSDWFAVLTDLKFVFPMSYQPLPDSAPTQEIAYKFTPRANLALDWTLTPAWSLKQGFLWAPTSLTRDAAASSEEPRQLFWGATLGLEWTSDRIRSGLGGFWYQGQGDNPPIVGTGEDAHSTERHYGVLLTTSYRLD